MAERRKLSRRAAATGPAAPVVRPTGTRKERYEAGRALREACPRSAHAIWKAPPSRPDPVSLVLKADMGRVPELLPLRHGRMLRSPFTFYRGAALNMAIDLASTPVTGVRVQCCGDAHLCNFGGFATPERRVIFSINDLDETLPAPWEWDVKRLAASFVAASRDNGMTEGVAKDAVLACVRSYRELMWQLSEISTLELWYYAVDVVDIVAGIEDRELRRSVVKRVQKERGRSIAENIFPKLAEHRGKVPVIKDQLPTIFHDEGMPPGEINELLRTTIAGYRSTLPASTRSLLDRYQICDAAYKVVGIGSVGTRCWVVLLMAGEGDPLFLQIKEARASVLEPYAGASEFGNQGERIVNGYRLMQPASDLFLGWTRSPRYHFFVRQLRDTKISPRVEALGPAEMEIFATWCGRALAVSHARAGCPATLSGYMGHSDAFDRAIAAFASAYADQNERDHAALSRAVRKGTVEAVLEEAR